MKKYIVDIPITGHLGVHISAENKEEAKKLALDISSIDYISEWHTDDEEIQVEEIKYKL
ncbi:MULTISPECIES: hypothetical protein [unclassified Clostridioides]|uniref:hypothetical protein n=1 Tax=unclassified Clostridioides TaxID=2635829 RepID=UPI001D11773C|nr:hypothetical protein [Clostridioides sp. ZZV14-6150]MCC0724718.1 hypothetical protein [Clostridioides sp. ZZV14-6104]MCC0744812.1 hypothetical protein [Clostridioides sp. ZZV14-6044]MCC0745028.1 hypothetical protein [Clostridioides sp. ZZV14-6044]MCC0752967.1 hypothetical protein [Clostridioides sp. ZZV13-5731]